jgi:DNA-binding LacI/PurR family transcriptional regulator
MQKPVDQIQKPKKKVTMADIAREAGVSKPTVWAVLNPDREGNYRYSEDTRKRIMSVVEKYGYRPNRTARNFFSKRHGAIGLLVPTIGDVAHPTLSNMLHTSSENGLLLMIEEVPEGEGASPRMIKEDCVDGIVLFGADTFSRSEGISKINIPVIEVNTSNRFGPFSITFDEEGACSAIIEHLAHKGKKNPAFFHFAAKRKHYSLEVRQEILAEEALKCGMNQLRNCEVGDDEERERNIIHFLKNNKDIDAIILYNDYLAMTLFHILLTMHISVPSNTAVIGFNDSIVAQSVYPKLTSVTIDKKIVGVRIIEQMIDLINNGEKKIGPLKIPYELICRDST